MEPKPLPTNPNPGIQSIIDNVVAEQGLANWDAAGFERIGTTLRDVFRRKLVTPDEVRGKRATLRDAILRDGWPTLGKLRGRVLVVLNVAGELRDLYLAGAPSLQKRAMFVPSAPTQPSAAIVKRDVPQPNEVPKLVQLNYFVKTRADADAVEARARDLTRATAAITSGANLVATDYPVPDPTIGDYCRRSPRNRRRTLQSRHRARNGAATPTSRTAAASSVRSTQHDLSSRAARTASACRSPVEGVRPRSRSPLEDRRGRAPRARR